MFERTVSDVPLPPLRDPERVDGRIIAVCLKSTIYASQAVSWLQRNRGSTHQDYLHEVLRPHRDAGTLPTLNNWQDFAAFVLTLPPPPEPEPPVEVTIREYLG